MGLRLSGELAECEGNSPAVRIQTIDSHQLCEQIGRGAKGTINDKMKSLSQTIHVFHRAGACLNSTSPVGLVVALLIQAVAVSVVDNASLTRSTSRNEGDCGGHVRTIVTLYIMTQAYELVIPIRDMSLYDACDKK